VLKRLDAHGCSLDACVRLQPGYMRLQPLLAMIMQRN